MDTATITFVGTIISIIVAFAIASMNVFSNRLTGLRLEQVKSELSILTNKSYFKFSKSHELQIEALKILSKGFSKVEKEVFSENSKSGMVDDLEASLESFTTNYYEYKFFLGKPIQITFDQMIIQFDSYLKDIKNINGLVENGSIQESIDEITARTEKYTEFLKALGLLTIELENQIILFLNGN